MTPYYLLDSSYVQCHESFRNNQGYERHHYPGESCNSCGQIVSKIIPTYAEPPTLLRELLTPDSAEARHFCKNIHHYNSALAMASV